MQGKKRIAVLLGLPLGASSLLLPGSPAQATEAAVSAAPSATCATVAFQPPNPFGSIVGEGFLPNENVRFSSGGQVVGNAAASAAGTATIGSVNLSAASISLQGTSSGRSASCAGMGPVTPPPVTPPPGTPPPGTPPPATPGERDQALAAGENDGDATCRQKVDLFKRNADKSPAFRADYATGFNNEVAATSGCAQMLAQIRSGLPATATQPGQTTQQPGQGQRRGQGERRGQGQNR